MAELKSALLFGVTIHFKMKMGAKNLYEVNTISSHAMHGLIYWSVTKNIYISGHYAALVTNL